MKKQGARSMFLDGLDEFFLETFADYDKISTLKGYVMPKMQDTKILKDGRKYAYTLPMNTMRLATQKNKDELLKEWKSRHLDLTVSFTFRPVSFFSYVKDKFDKNAFYKEFLRLLKEKGLSVDEAFQGITIEKDTVKKILKGKYYPTKNLIFSLSLKNGFDLDETNRLLGCSFLSFDFVKAKDVVVYYLLKEKVENPELIFEALEEYKIDGLFLEK